MKCDVCGKKDGPCGQRQSKKSYLYIHLRTNFQDHLNVPCFARKKLNAATNNYLFVETPNKELYAFKLNKKSHKTRIFGDNYEKFLLDYDMKHGDKIRLDYDNTPPYLLLHPLDKKDYIKDRVEEKYVFQDIANAVVFSKDMNPTPTEIARINRHVLDRGMGLGAIFLHKITYSDIKQNNMHIPKAIASVLNIDKSGNATLVKDEDGAAQPAKYYTSTDRRIRFNSGFKEFAIANEIKIGNTVLIMFHRLLRGGLQISFDVIA